MLKILVVDINPEACESLCGLIGHLVSAPIPEEDRRPRIRLLPAPLGSLAPHSARVICIAGPQLLTDSFDHALRLRLLLPRALLVAVVPARLDCLETVRQLAARGVQDFMPLDLTPHRIAERLILWASLTTRKRRAPRPESAVGDFPE